MSRWKTRFYGGKTPRDGPRSWKDFNGIYTIEELKNKGYYVDTIDVSESSYHDMHQIYWECSCGENMTANSTYCVKCNRKRPEKP